MKKNLVLVAIIILIFLNLGTVYADAYDESLEDELNISYEKGKVISVEMLKKEGDYPYDYQKVFLSIETGEYEGEKVEIENVLPENVAYRIEVEEGDLVVLGIEENNKSREIYISDYSRNGTTIILVIIFLLMLILVGKGKGIKSVITISLTMILIFKVLLPGILKGWDPLLLAIIVSTVITVLTIIIISGFCKKSFAAIIGTVSGVVIAAVVAIVVGNIITITGLMPDEAGMLLYIPQEINFNFNNLLFAGILLGALGAVMDVAMSIASSIQEIYAANNKLTRKALFSSGMVIGHDIMGTMSNTLILAYTGSSIPLLLILMSYDTPLKSIANLDIVATEIVRSLAGSIGLVVTIPITALVSVLLLEAKK